MLVLSTNKKQQIPTKFPKYLHEKPEAKNPTPITIEGGYHTFSANTPYGQVSDIRILGKTIYNHADNGVDYANWSISGAGTTKGVNGIHLVADAGNDGATIPINLKNATQYTLVYYVRTKDAADTLYIKDIISDTKIPSNIGINKCLITTDITFNRIKFFLSYLETDGKYIDFELYAILEGDYTADTSVNKPFKFGVNSTNSVRVKSVGKNLWDDIKGLNTSNYETVGFYNYLELKLKPNTYYTICLKDDFDLNSLPLAVQGNYALRVNNTKTTDPRKTVINVTSSTRSKNTITIQTNSDGSFYISTYQMKQKKLSLLQNAIMLNEGATSLPYEPYTESTQYLPNVGELRSLPNGTKDEVNVTSGIKTQRTKEYILQASDFEIFSTSHENYDSVLTKINLVSDITSKHNSIKSTDYLAPGYSHTSFENMNAPYQSAWTTTLRLKLTFPKGTYADLAAAQTALTGLSLIYQLAVPEVSYHPDSELVCYPGGHFSIESEAIDAGDSTMPTAIVSPPPGLLLPITIESKDIFEPTYLDQDFIL